MRPPGPVSGRILLFNKPHGVLTRFTDDAGRVTLKEFIPVPDVYPVGRLDADSEGLLLLTDRGSLVQPLLAPGAKSKRYLVCVEGEPDEAALRSLRGGLLLKDGVTLPAKATRVEAPEWLWERDPPIRFRKSVPTSWLEIEIREGRNRQVRRMTAAVGLPTLRLIRLALGPVELGGLALGQWREASAVERAALLEVEAGAPMARKQSRPPTKGGKPAMKGVKKAMNGTKKRRGARRG